MKYNCLIIDDHKLFNDGLKLILKESGHFDEIWQVFDSRVAVESCNRFLPDLVLIDYNMPHLNGLEVVKAIQQHRVGFKIVIISMYAERSQIKLFYDAGVDGFISKTIEGRKLSEVLLIILNGKKYFIDSNLQSEKADNFLRKGRLTKREIQILKLMKEDYTSSQMASELCISQFTVETHRKNINKKLNFESKSELYKFLEIL